MILMMRAQKIWLSLRVLAVFVVATIDYGKAADCDLAVAGILSVRSDSEHAPNPYEASVIRWRINQVRQLYPYDSPFSNMSKPIEVAFFLENEDPDLMRTTSGWDRVRTVLKLPILGGHRKENIAERLRWAGGIQYHEIAHVFTERYMEAKSPYWRAYSRSMAAYSKISIRDNLQEDAAGFAKEVGWPVFLTGQDYQSFGWPSHRVDRAIELEQRLRSASDMAQIRSAALRGSIELYIFEVYDELISDLVAAILSSDGAIMHQLLGDETRNFLIASRRSASSERPKYILPRTELTYRSGHIASTTVYGYPKNLTPYGALPASMAWLWSKAGEISATRLINILLESVVREFDSRILEYDRRLSNFDDPFIPGVHDNPLLLSYADVDARLQSRLKEEFLRSANNSNVD